MKSRLWFVFRIVCIVGLLAVSGSMLFAQTEEGGGGVPLADLAVVTALLTSVVSPWLVYGLKAVAPGLFENQGLPTNLTIAVVLHLAAWWLLGGADPATLRDYLMASGMSFGVSSSGVAVGKMQEKRKR